MEKKLQAYLDNVFAPYGDFPARDEVKQELLANLKEKYADLKKQSLSDDEAYRATVESFGDVAEIMEQVSHTGDKQEKPEEPSKVKAALHDYLGIGEDAHKSKFRYLPLVGVDLGEASLRGEDFTSSALMGAIFDKSDLTKAVFKSAALKGASFVGANLSEAMLNSCDLQDVKFNKADLTETSMKSCALHGADFTGAKLVSTNFSRCDSKDVSFDGLTLSHVVFDGASLNHTSFRNATLHDVTFRYSAVKGAKFEGAAMDKVTYAILKGAKAGLANVTVA